MTYKLKMLKPSVPMLNTSRVRVLARNPGATPRLSDRSGHAAAKIRKQVLAEEPICRVCQAKTPPRVTASEEVDHIVALEDGGREERENVQGICRACHLVKSAEERRRRACL
jgi:5-methylcytosine-specific restriction endonuclease McrA